MMKFHFKMIDDILQELVEAIDQAALAKNQSLTFEKKLERIKAELFLREEGSIEVRKNKTIVSDYFQGAKGDYIKSLSEYNIKKAAVDGLIIKYEIWRSKASTRRAELNLL